MPAKLDKLIAQKKSLDERIAKEKVKAKQRERKDDTRRKILVGALALKHMEHDATFKSTIEQLLDAHLDKAMDRKLFSLPEKKTSSTSTISDNTKTQTPPSPESYFSSDKG